MPQRDAFFGGAFVILPFQVELTGSLMELTGSLKVALTFRPILPLIIYSKFYRFIGYLSISQCFDGYGPQLWHGLCTNMLFFNQVKLKLACYFTAISAQSFLL